MARGVYGLVSGLEVHLFRCAIVEGVPAVPASGEIAEVRWCLPDEIPEPRTNILHHSLADVVSGSVDLARSGLERIS